MKLQIADRSLHYLEKIVPPFEQPRMPTAKELSELVEIKTPVLSEYHANSKTENLLDYSHRNRACKLKVNFENFKHYSLVCVKPLELDETLDLNEDSCFGRILPDGRLDINVQTDSEDESFPKNGNRSKSVDWTDNNCLLDDEFCKKYNIKLYNHEIDSLLNVKKPLKEKHTPIRDGTGKFVKRTKRSLREHNKSLRKKEFKRIVNCSSSEEDSPPRPRVNRKKTKNSSRNESEDEVVEVPIDCFDFSDSDVSILQDDDVIEETNLSSVDNGETFLRPYKDYWMYHCIFSRVKGKNFDLFEKELPENFRWLLNECADVVEMAAEDLYEEVCLIEAYHLNILKAKGSKNDGDYELHDCKSKSYANNVLNKW